MGRVDAAEGGEAVAAAVRADAVVAGAVANGAAGAVVHHADDEEGHIPVSELQKGVNHKQAQAQTFVPGDEMREELKPFGMRWVRYYVIDDAWVIEMR